MNLSLLILFFTSVLNYAIGAPAVSTVHVRFVSGNKATQYSHSNGPISDGTSLDYNIVDDSSTDERHSLKRRSVTSEPKEHGEIRRLKPRTTSFPDTTSTTAPTLVPQTLNPTSTSTRPNYDDKNSSTNSKRIGHYRRRKRNKKKVQFTGETNVSSLEGASSSIVSSTAPALELTDVELPVESSLPTDETLKPKDSKAVKRSPFPTRNFGSFNFPDFDEFGGNEFGSLGNHHFAQPNGGPSHAPLKAESLAPEGLFLPPIPTSESNHVEDDPYLADAETAKYAAQHPPFFHEFPHKRTVLDLNEQRVNNGLEPNILRSIRPFFAFFEINNHGSTYGPYQNYHYQPILSHPIYHVYPIPSYVNYDDPEELFYYAESRRQPKVTKLVSNNNETKPKRRTRRPKAE